MEKFKPTQRYHKPFYRSKVCELLIRGIYDTMRSNISCMVVFSLIQYLRPSNILEIGFWEGQTFSLMMEASQPGTTLTAIDIQINRRIFDQYFQDLMFGKNVKLLEIPSQKYVPDCKYDFVNVDGSPDRYSDLMRVVDWMHDDGVIMVDNYDTMHDQIVEFLQKSPLHAWVPFLIDDQALYFHKTTSDHTKLLDELLETKFSQHFDTANILYEDHVVKKIWDKPRIIGSNIKIFTAVCKEYNF